MLHEIWYNPQTFDIRHTLVSNECWSFRCSWSVASRRCCNYLFILDLTPGFNRLRKENCKTRQETYQFLDLVRLVLDVWWYIGQRLNETLDNSPVRVGNKHTNVVGRNLIVNALNRNPVFMAHFMTVNSRWTRKQLAWHVCVQFSNIN